MKFKWIGVDASDTQSMGIVNLENRSALRALGWEILREPLRARYRPTPEVLDECRHVGKLLAERATALVNHGAGGP